MKLIRWKYTPWILLVLLLIPYILLKRQTVPGGRLLMNAVLMGFGCFAAFSDLREKLVPNQLILAMLCAWAVVLIPQLFLHTEQGLVWLLDGLIGFVVCFVLMLLVYLVGKKGLGGADLKFMSVAGLYLGWSGSLSTLLIGSVLAGLTCGVLILLKKLSMKGSIPLIPFLFFGVLFTLFTR
jgi:Flp pilus assembly protein protease CpaA